MATSMGRARSIADNAADIAKLPADFDAFTIIKPSMFKPMERLGSIVSRIAAKLRPADEDISGSVDRAPCEKKPAVDAGRLPANVQSGGDDVMAAGVLGKSARAIQGRNMARASAHDREGSGALIVGTEARHESVEIHLVGISPAPGRAIAAPLKLGRDSFR